MDFLSNCTSGGCGAKMDPDVLHRILSELPTGDSSHLMVGFQDSDDAAVYQMNEQQAVVSTVDFFPPMVEDPYLFGKIAAANALSDIWAMGGTLLYALNIVCFPQKGEESALGEMLRGGYEKVIEGGGITCGGHSIYDREIKYGLAVTGIVSPQCILRNNTPKIGDALILTKPLGTGLVLGAHRVGVATQQQFAECTNSMQQLNRYASEKLADFSVSACTDITGFGFAAHALEMADNQVSLSIDTQSLPLLSGSLEFAEQYLFSAGAQRNRNHVGHQVDLSSTSQSMQELLFDPQTSGGLLISVPMNQANSLLSEIQKTDPLAAMIGVVEPKSTYQINFYG